MTKILVIHGAGMNMRGKVGMEIFGPMTLPEYNTKIEEYAKELSVEVKCFHSNIEGEVANAIYETHDNGTDAIIINPAGFNSGVPVLLGALRQVNIPSTEVHITNPTARGGVSVVLPVCKRAIYGFGIFGYYLAMKGAVELAND
jgi:3-dehydroquinate dehydratase-2